MDNHFYITTTLPYVNAKPHLGFAWEILTADFIARYQRLQGKKVIFNTGTDEHGQKILQQAIQNNLSPQAYVDQLSRNFLDLTSLLSISNTNFIRTTDPQHLIAAEHFWNLCLKNGDIYQKKYQVKYCIGCELEKTDSELVDGRCPLHPNQELEFRAEENYFFRFSRYQEKLLALYQNKPNFILGAGKMSEIISFAKGGLQDFSISRLKEKMSWGIPVPHDPAQVMYVWFDALINYISTLGWPNHEADYQEFWPGIQICGKDNLRQQSAMWQAMLFSAQLPSSQQILVNGFITVNGQKMSKSLGNIIDPSQLLAKYGLNATRFIIASFPVLSGDVDITDARLNDFYTAHLTNGLGNLCSRLAKLASVTDDNWHLSKPTKISSTVAQFMNQFLTHQALQSIIEQISLLDQSLSRQKPWLIKDDLEKRAILTPILQQLLQLIYDLQIFIPDFSDKLLSHFTQSRINPLQPLFPKIKS